jgi:hypothetical protein
MRAVVDIRATKPSFKALSVIGEGQANQNEWKKGLQERSVEAFNRHVIRKGEARSLG